MAGLIPQGFIDDLLARTDIIDVIGERMTLKKAGRNHQGLCPFHKEKSPSFTANQDKQFYYCFGCGASGNAMGFVMDFDHVDFPEAVEMLARRAGMQVPREASASPEKRERYDTLYNQLATAAKWYAEQLASSDASHKASDYLKRRGLDQSTIERFQIGYAPEGWDNLIQKLGNTPERLRLLLDAGLVVENEERKSTYDRFRDRVIFPIRDQRGRVIGFGGRVLGDEKPKYLNSPETAVFHKGRELYGLYEARQANRDLSQILVVEGYMDVIALAQQGITNAVATLGTATSAEHLNILFKHTSQVTFCFDGDNAGRQAAWRALENALSVMDDGRQIRFLFLPQGEDPDSLVRTEGPEAFLTRLQDKTQALPFDDYFFKHFEQEIDTTTLDGKARLVHKVTPFIHKLPQGSFKSLMIKKLGDISDLGTETVNSIIQTNIDAGTPTYQQQPATTYEAPYQPQDNYQDSPYAYQAEEHYGSTDSSQPYKGGKKPFKKFRPFGKGEERPAPPPSIMLRPQQRALRLLLERPDLASQIDASKLNMSSGDEDIRFLGMLVESLLRNPVESVYGVLGSWYGTRLGERLTLLMKTDIPTDNAEQTLEHCLKSLTVDVQQGDKELSDMDRLRMLHAKRQKDWFEKKQIIQQENPTKH
ncbi:DNA primase [Parendozoicomonas haliclonae]|uniref:DNA primase n=1 Tax=Parendozoicomonas haliclonae TaxID=1960125 RepID=A0A1X7ADF0_9GAMM|nr:DNA primase [Parendozoicomonas haliclonae]SMA31712.1 DNA primase [Parendozoicomonas haliclonae]